MPQTSLNLTESLNREIARVEKLLRWAYENCSEYQQSEPLPATVRQAKARLEIAIAARESGDSRRMYLALGELEAVV